MPAVNDVGEPCAGEPHARFDGRELETERIGHGHDSGTAGRETVGIQGCRAYRHIASPRQFPTLPLVGWSCHSANSLSTFECRRNTNGSRKEMCCPPMATNPCIAL